MILSRRNALLAAGAVGSAALAAIPAAAQSQVSVQQSPAMQQLYIGWEVGNLNNNGANAYRKVNRPIIITGLQLFASMAPTGQPRFGFCEVLANVVASPTVPTFLVPPHEYINMGDAFGGEDDWQPAVTNNPNGLAINGSIGPGGTGGNLASWILKSMSNQCPNSPIERTNLAIPLPAGGVICIHVDHYGDSGADFEIQGSIEYV